MPKGCQNGARINENTHHKSMQKQVVEKMRKIMKHNVFLMCDGVVLVILWQCVGDAAATTAALEEGGVRSVENVVENYARIREIASKIHPKSIKMRPGDASGGLWGASRFPKGARGVPHPFLSELLRLLGDLGRHFGAQ